MNVVIRVILAAATCVLALPKHAQEYPQRPIRLVIGMPAGGTTDILGRVIAARLGGETVPGFQSIGWFGIFGPAKISEHVVKRVNAQLAAFMNDPDVRERLLATGAEPVSGPPELLRNQLAREMEVWGKLIREAGLKVE